MKWSCVYHHGHGIEEVQAWGQHVFVNHCGRDPIQQSCYVPTTLAALVLPSSDAGFTPSGTVADAIFVILIEEVFEASIV